MLVETAKREQSLIFESNQLNSLLYNRQKFIAFKADQQPPNGKYPDQTEARFHLE